MIVLYENCHIVFLGNIRAVLSTLLGEESSPSLGARMCDWPGPSTMYLLPGLNLSAVLLV